MTPQPLQPPRNLRPYWEQLRQNAIRDMDREPMRIHIDPSHLGVIELLDWQEHRRSVSSEEHSDENLLRRRIDNWLASSLTTPDEWTVERTGEIHRDIPVRLRIQDGGIEQNVSMVSAEICTCANPNGEPICIDCGRWTGAFSACECDVETLPCYESSFGFHNDICSTCLGNQAWRSELTPDPRFQLIDPALD